jgi:hypothetical protein
MSSARLQAAIARFRSLVDVTDQPGSSPPPEETAPESDSYVKQLLDGMQAIRDQLRRMGAGLASAGGIILAGLGYTQLHQIFPLPEDAGTLHLHWWSIAGKTFLQWLAIFGAFAAPLGAIWLAARFYGAQRRIPMSTDKADLRRYGLSRKETKLAGAVLDDYARAEEAHSLLALDLRADRIRRIARRLPSLEKEWTREADRIDSVVDTAMVDASYGVLERRAENAFRGWRTVVALFLAVAGIVALFAVADYSKGRRDLIDLQSKCADAVAKGAADACKPVRAAADARTLKAKTEAAAKRTRDTAVAQAKKLAPHAFAVYKKVVACTKLLNSDNGFAATSEGLKTAAIAACARLGG